MNRPSSVRWSAVALVALAGLVPPIAATPARAQDAADPRSSQNLSRVALPGGLVIHSTPNAVMNPRAVTFADSPMVLMLWDEMVGGAQTPHYAVSRDGRSLAGRVRETSYQVRLKYGAFDPLTNRFPAVEAGLTAPAESALYLVQCLATPLPEFQQQIEASGGQILRFIPDHAMIVRMGEGAGQRVSALPFVRWTGRFHTAYKLDQPVLQTLREHASDTAEARYSIEVFERGMGQQQVVAARVRALGGTVEVFTQDQFRMEASLTPAQLLQIARMDEVHFIDPWGGPGGLDTDIVRNLSGANFIETTLGFTGQGVRGEVFDSEVRTTHENLTFPITLHSASAGNPADPHGTSVMGIVFGDGVPTAQARGLLPSAEARIFFWYADSTQFGGATSRLTLDQQLVNPAGPYRAVFQTSSIGSTQVTTYTTISAEVDDYLYQTQLLSCQSQSNTDSQLSRPQAWAKNIVSVGAFNPRNTAGRAVDTYEIQAGDPSCGWVAGDGASVGPAADGRVKPDLAFFFDCTFNSTNASNTAYTQFGGTSGATPSTAGCFGLFFQMWHEQVWKGRGGASTVFDSRCHMTTAKAALCNTAFRYDWNLGGLNGAITRNVQGWGQADLQSLYNLRDKTFIVDEEDVLPPLGVKTYYVRVEAGEPDLNVTMSYVDRMGSTTSTPARINDLSLKVTSPTGVVFWGNNGLAADNTSNSGGVSNTIDTVENVFVPGPAAGVWRVQVFGDDIVQDTHAETAAIDADFSIWCTGARQVLDQGPWGYTVQSNGNDHLYRINLSTGDSTDLGLVTLNDAEGLCVGPQGDLFAIGGTVNELWNVSLPPGTLVGATGPRVGLDAGLDYFNGTMYNMEGNIGASNLYRINTSTGAATLIGGNSQYLGDLAINGLGQAFGIDGITTDSLYSVSLASGAATVVGGLGLGNISNQFGSSFAEDSTLWAIRDNGQIYTINTATGAASSVASIDVNGLVATGFEGLAIDRTSACRPEAIPAFATTFSAVTTRGYWFTCPANIQICGLRVPNEFGETVQNIEVVRFKSAVPTFPATSNDFVSLGRYVNADADDIVHVDIPASAGDIIGVLGACGTTTMRNSYAATTANTFGTSVKGLPTTLTRMGMQFNLNTTAARDLWTEGGANPLSRVELYYLDGTNEVYLDGDTAATGSNLATAPLTVPPGVVTFSGELVVGSDAEMIAAGSLGNVFDITGAIPNAAAQLTFNFDVESVTFLYGGNIGEITVTARNGSGGVVDTFFQADTNAGQPAGPVTLAGPGIRTVRWNDPTGNFAPLDNIRIRATTGCYANCDGSTTPPVANVADFTCFLQKFAAGDGYANCDGSTAVPTINVADFTCFLQRFAAGCN